MSESLITDVIKMAPDIYWCSSSNFISNKLHENAHTHIYIIFTYVNA